MQPADYEAVDSQIREMDEAESGKAPFSPLEPLTLEALRQARQLMLRTLLLNRSVRPDLHTHVLFYGVGRGGVGGVQDLTAMLMPTVSQFAQLRLLREISAAAADAGAGAPAATQSTDASPSPAVAVRIDEARRGGMTSAALAELIEAHASIASVASP